MKVLKVIVIVVLILIALLLIVALFVKKDYKVERSVSITKPSDSVFNYVKFVKNQDNFSVWNNLDPNMKKDYKGTDGTVGFVYAWDSQNKQAGKGEQEISNIQEGKEIDMKLRFKKPMESESDAYIITEHIDSTTTKVTWGIKGKMPYPFNIMCLFMNMDKTIGGDLSKNLDNLKVLLEKK